MDDSKQRRIGAVLSYVSIAISTLIQLLYIPLLISKLGQSEYGLYSLVISIIGYLAVLDLGFGNAIIVYTAKFKAEKKFNDEKKLHGMFKIVFIIIGIIAFVLGIILYFNVENIFRNSMTDIELAKMKTMMLILAFNLLFTFSFAIYGSIISAYEKFVYQKLLGILSSIIKPVLMIPFLFMGYKSITMCLIVTFINVTIVLLNYFYCRKKLCIIPKFRGFDKSLFKTILGYSVWIFIGIIVDRVNWSLDNFILGAVSGTIAVSIYAIASTLNTLFINLSIAISGVLLPKMSKLVSQHATSRELTNEMIKVGRIQQYIIFLMCSGFILFGKNFIMMWAGDAFEEAYYVALLLIIPICIPLIQNLGLSIIQAMNKFRFKSITTFIMAIFNVIISILLAKKFGVIGVAFGTCIALIVCNIILMNIYYYKVIKIDIFRFWREIIRETIPFIIPILTILFIMNITTFDRFPGFVIYGTAYTIIYFITAYLFSMNKYEKEIIDNVLIKFHLKKVRI